LESYSGRVRVNENLLFPAALARARRVAKLSQVGLARALAVDQSYICGLEKGRRGTPRPEVVEQLASALAEDSAPSTAGDLRWTAAHDRVIQALNEPELAGAASLVSVVLRAHRRLAPDELAGLASYMKNLVDSRERLDRVAGRIPAWPGEGVEM
jgi:transcriptional regulator with XRE-family HTH domain